MEDVVAEDEASGVIAYEVFADNESLGESIRGWLLCVGEMDAIISAISKKTLQSR